MLGGCLEGLKMDYDWNCYCCGKAYKWDRDPALMKSYICYCASCRVEIIGGPSGGVPGYCNQGLGLEPRAKALRARYRRPDDAEELRLRAILTRPADKNYCPCGIHREQCTYHGPQPKPTIPASVFWK